MLATLLRRVGRLADATDALEKLSASDSGARWQTAMAAERQRIAETLRDDLNGDEPATIPIADANIGDFQNPSERAAAA